MSALFACLCGVAAAFSNPRHLGASRLACPASKAERLKSYRGLERYFGGHPAFWPKFGCHERRFNEYPRFVRPPAQ